MGEFIARKNEFLVFEDGPSRDITLQWATYYDASDQCSLSRIWGGIHPPVDDIPGRLIGRKVGLAAFELAESYFSSTTNTEEHHQTALIKIGPNPLHAFEDIKIGLFASNAKHLQWTVLNLQGIPFAQGRINTASRSHSLRVPFVASGVYLLVLQGDDHREVHKLIVK